jgi:hypothetical protein
VSRRHTNKHSSRLSRGMRQMLVHRVGCVNDRYVIRCMCAFLGDPRDEAIDYLKRCVRPVRVPRSMRGMLGTTIGGAS